MHIRQHISTSLSAMMVVGLLTVLWYEPLPAAPRDEISLVLTADTAGQVVPCRACPGPSDLGGLARRATLMAQLRHAHPSLLLVDAGNALFGAESLESQGRVIVAAYNVLEYDAVNLSYRDFRRGKAATLTLLRDAQFAVLSANLLDADTGQALVQPYIIKPLASERIALIGLTQSPAGLAYLPHLKEQLAGIHIQPPLEALAQWLPRVQADADRVVLLYYGTLAGLQAMRERFGHAVAAILVGGSRPADLPAEVEPPVIGTGARGRHVTHLRLASPAGEARAESTQLALEPTIPADNAIATLVDQFKGAGGASEALPGQERHELASSSQRSPAAETPPQPPQGSSTPTPQGHEKAISADVPSQSESGVNTPERPQPLIIGESLRLGMLRQDVLALLGPPQSTTVEQGTASQHDRLRLEYPAHGLVMGITTQGLVLDLIEVLPAFTGQFASGVRLGDPVTALITAYGMPASMTPERALYPDQGFVFRFDNATLSGATVSLASSQPPDKRAESAGKSLAAEQRSSPHTPEMTSPPSGAGKDPRQESTSQTTAQETTQSTAEAADPQPQAEQVTGPPTGLEIALPGAKIDAVLARDVTASAEPVSPTSEFPEDAETIYLVLTSKLTQRASVHVRWIAAHVEEWPLNHQLAEARLWNLRPGHQGTVELKAPQGGFSPGDYQMDLVVDGSPAQSLPFTVVPLLPPAVLAEQAEVPHGFNIALAALGGKVERATSEYNDTTWAAANVIDGMVSKGTGGWLATTNDGWSSTDNTLPQEFVFSFYQTREARISTIVIDTTTSETVRYPDRLPKHVEVWTSTTSPTDGFSKIAGARLQRRPVEHVIAFPPTPATYVKVRFLSNHGGTYTQVGEVKIIEAREGAPSILRDLPKNLASPALGGAVVQFTSQYSKPNGVHQLVDGRTDSWGWQSADDYLPQEFVFAFRDDQVALIDQIILHPKTHRHPTAWPQHITVSVSTESPLDGFEEVGQFTLQQGPREQAFPIGRRARFVKLRILENFGGRSTSLGEVQVIEGTAQGYASILFETPEATAVSRDAALSEPVDETGIALEAEPNGTPAEANPLEFGRRTKGVIDPLGEEDDFQLTVPGPGPSVLTLELLGRPNIRTSLTLLDAVGNRLKRFDPGALPAQQATFSWTVEPGEHILHVTEPPISMVLIWDTSGSMKGRTEDLQRAVEMYIDQIRPSERLNLVRFSRRETEVLLPEFSSDRERLKVATAEKFFADGGTPFYDAVAKGIELLEGVGGNRAIVVMTDGADTASRLDHPGFWQLLQDKRIRLYTIGLGWQLKEYEPKIASGGERVLKHSAMATNGRFFFAHTADELQGFYQQIADELRTLSTYYLRPTLSPGTGSLSVVATGERLAAVSAPPQLELILDASGSMKRKLGGRRMIDIAKDAMVQIIEDLPDDLQVALRLYGHRIREGRRGDCQDSELVVPFAKIDKPRLLERVRRIRALGTTPIAYALQQVAGDFGTAPGEKIVILVTDGKEECRGDPSAVVSELLAKKFQVRLNVVGFALGDEATKREMQQIAELTGGHFFDAKDAKALHGAIEQALAVPYDVLDAAGSRVASGLTGQGTISMPEGVYTVVVRAAGTPITIADVRIAHDQVTRIELKKEGQEVGRQVLGPVQRHEAPWTDEAQAALPAAEPPPLQVPTASPGQPEPQAPSVQSPEAPGPLSSQPLPDSDLAARLAQLLDEAQRLLADQKLTIPQGASAYDRYQEVLRLDPKNPEAKQSLASMVRTYQQWGQAALKQGDYPKAIRQYRRALHIDGRNVDSYSALALAYRKNGAYAEAIHAYRQALQLAPTRSELRQDFAEVHAKQVQKALRARGLTGVKVQVDPKLRLTLTGAVNTPEEKQAAVTIAQAQPGITAVIDQLTNRTQSTIKAFEGGTFR